jgi:hypothetical protein
VFAIPDANRIQSRRTRLVAVDFTILFEDPMEKFLRGRLDLVNVLAADAPGASYGDLVLIMTAVLSACASVRWPGTGIDKRRFIELLVIYSPEDSHASWVGVPALINQGLLAEIDTPYGPGESDQIFCDHEIDLAFDDAKTKYPQVPSRQLRKHSYASLIYEWLRCGYAHEYCPHESINEMPASERKARVSYIGRGTPTRLQRRIAFHFDYLMELAQHHVSTLPKTPSPAPSKWWIDQG